MSLFTKPVYADGVNIPDTLDSPLTDIGSLISTLLPNIYMVAGIIFFFLIIGGGFAIISSAGKGAKEGVANGQKALTAGIIGFILIVGSYWIIKVIEIVTGLAILSPVI